MKNYLMLLASGLLIGFSAPAIAFAEAPASSDQTVTGQVQLVQSEGRSGGSTWGRPQPRQPTQRSGAEERCAGVDCAVRGFDSELLKKSPDPDGPETKVEIKPEEEGR